jgi:serine/threonine protein kinase
LSTFFVPARASRRRDKILPEIRAADADRVARFQRGTAAYMSPEQARGKPVGKHADMWGLGCVVFELLTGVQAFAGETVSDTLAAVLAREPDWTKLPASTPEPLRKILGSASRRIRSGAFGDGQCIVPK